MGERAGIWLRVSGSGQDEQNQLPEIMAWCERHGYDVVKRYIIHGKSAHKGNKTFDRTWASVIHDMLTGNITVLVVWKLDRMDRKLQTFQMIAEVVGANGRVEFTTQTQLNDLSTMGGRISLKIQEEIAYAESKDKSDRIRIANVKIRTNAGNPGRAPWGYVSAGEKYHRDLIPTDEGRRYVEKIFERIADGQSLATVGAWLESETGRQWWPRRIAWMITNPTYRGHRIDANGVTVHECEALVDADLWMRANKALTAKPGKRGPASGPSALLTSALFCGPCRDKGVGPSPMYRITPRRGYVYYRCNGKGTSRGCGNMVILPETDQLVTEWLSMREEPRKVPQLVKGDSQEIEIAIAGVLLELAELPRRDLSDDKEDSERKRLRARRDKLEEASRHARPDRLENVSFCRTCGGNVYSASCEAAGHPQVTTGEHFRSLDETGKRAMLLSDHIKVYAWKPEGEREFLPIEIEFPES